MEIILLNNGQPIIINSQKDMLEVVEENLSYELAKYISSILWNQDEIEKELEELEKQNSDLINECDMWKEKIEEYEKHKPYSDDYFTLKDNEYFNYLVNEIGG